MQNALPESSIDTNLSHLLTVDSVFCNIIVGVIEKLDE